jgi:hypothetical protein
MKVEDIAEAIAKLPPDQLARFRHWFAAFEAGRTDHTEEWRVRQPCRGPPVLLRHTAAAACPPADAGSGGSVRLGRPG